MAWEADFHCDLAPLRSALCPELFPTRAAEAAMQYGVGITRSIQQWSLSHSLTTSRHL